MAGLKQIHGARVVLLRLDGADASAAADSLRSLGMVHAVGLSHPGELSIHIEAGRVDVVVVAAAAPPPPPGMPPAAPAAALTRPPDAAVRGGIPCLLLVPAFSRAIARAATTMGYAAAMSADAAPRLIYRRVGALMQRVRRAGRAREAASDRP